MWISKEKYEKLLRDNANAQAEMEKMLAQLENSNSKLKRLTSFADNLWEVVNERYSEFTDDPTLTNVRFLLAEEVDEIEKVARVVLEKGSIHASCSVVQLSLIKTLKDLNNAKQPVPSDETSDIE